MSDDELRPMPPAVIPPKGTRLGVPPAVPAWLWWVIGVIAGWLAIFVALAIVMSSGRS